MQEWAFAGSQATPYQMIGNYNMEPAAEDMRNYNAAASSDFSSIITGD